jgi:hypothetical protein
MNLLQLMLISRVPITILEIFITLDLQAPWNVAACAGVLFACCTCIQYCASNIIHYDYGFGATIGGIAMDAIHLTLLFRPLHVFRHNKQTQPAHKLPWRQRFMWVTELYGAARGIGWNFQVSSFSSTS